MSSQSSSEVEPRKIYSRQGQDQLETNYNK